MSGRCTVTAISEGNTRLSSSSNRKVQSSAPDRSATSEFNGHLDLLFEFSTLNSLRENFTSGFVCYFSQAQRSSDYCSLSNNF